MAAFTLACSGGEKEQAPTLWTLEVIGKEGGAVTLSDRASVVLPPGAVQDRVEVEFGQYDGVVTPPAFVQLGSAYSLVIEGGRILEPLTLVLPFESSPGHQGATTSSALILVTDPATSTSEIHQGQLDSTRSTVSVRILPQDSRTATRSTVRTSHGLIASPVNWNYDYGAAILNGTLTLKLTGLWDAIALLTDECRTGLEPFRVDSTQSMGMIRGCISSATLLEANIRVLNISSFHVMLTTTPTGLVTFDKHLLASGPTCGCSN